MHIVQAKLGQADAGDNEAKLMTKLSPERVRTSDNDQKPSTLPLDYGARPNLTLKVYVTWIYNG